MKNALKVTICIVLFLIVFGIGGYIEVGEPKEEVKIPIAYYAQRVMNNMPIVTASGDIYRGAYLTPSKVYEMEKTKEGYVAIEEAEEKVEEVIEEYVEPKQEPKQEPKKEEKRVSYGDHLTARGGVYWFGDQKETWYNLDMSNIVSSIKNHGWVWNDIADEYKQNVEGEYWIREDGCKMLGDYIMVATNLEVHPRGSLVMTSLGMGVAVDTGGFAKNNPLQVDIAVNW